MPDEHIPSPLAQSHVQILGRMIETRLAELHSALELRLILTLGQDEGMRMVGGVKDAAVDFLFGIGHTPDLVGGGFDHVAQTLLECVFMQNPSLMGPDGTAPEGLPKRDKVQGEKDLLAQIKREERAGWEIGDHKSRPHHPDGWQQGGR